MNILIIPDVHQTGGWKYAVANYYNDYDYIIQVGDWFDTHDPNFDWEANDPIANFRSALKTTKEYPKFKICFGNHDFSYLLKSHCSNFQWDHYKEIRDVLMEAVPYVNIAYEVDGWVISHAGFTKTWMKDNGFETIEQVNEAFHKMNFDIFQFCGWDIYGDDPSNGPCWVRPASLYRDAYFKYQVVGHTPVDNAPLYLDCRGEITKVLKPSIEGQKIILIDNDKHDIIFSLDTVEDKK